MTTFLVPMRAVSIFSITIQKICHNIENCKLQVSKNIREESLYSSQVLVSQLITELKMAWNPQILAKTRRKRIKLRASTEIYRWESRNSEKWLKESFMHLQSLFRSQTLTITTDFKEGTRQFQSSRKLWILSALTECCQEITWCLTWMRVIT